MFDNANVNLRYEISVTTRLVLKVKLKAAFVWLLLIQNILSLRRKKCKAEKEESIKESMMKGIFFVSILIDL